MLGAGLQRSQDEQNGLRFDTEDTSQYVGVYSTYAGYPSQILQLRGESATGIIAVIDINGVILGQKLSNESLFDTVNSEWATFGYEIKEQLLNLAQDDDIKAFVVRIDSPWGTIFWSKAISDAIDYIQKVVKKPVYAYISGLGASGGYWVAAGARKIYADAGTSIGSIWVIAGPFKHYESVMSESDPFWWSVTSYPRNNSFDWSVNNPGIKTSYISAGKGKDFGNPYRAMTDEEQSVTQNGVNNLYDLFVSHVASGRNLSGTVIREQVGAYVYDNFSAQKKWLIDQTLAFDDMLDLIAWDTWVNLSGNYAAYLFKPSQSSFESRFGAYMIDQTSQTVARGLCGSSSIALVFHGDLAMVCR